MSIFKTVKESDKECVAPNELFKMTIELWAKPERYAESLDTVLILDTSGSMIENGIEEMKEAACRYADIIAQSDKADNEGIMAKSRIAVVGFDSRAYVALMLSSDLNKIKSAVNSLTAKNYTNHADAFKKAYEVMKLSKSKRKIALMFTDGDSTIKGDTEIERQKLLSLGTEIFTIALGTPLSLRSGIVKSWASEIKEEHFFLIKEKCQINDVFKMIADGAACSYTKDIDIKEKLFPGFVIEEILVPEKGTAQKLDSRTLSWKIPSLGRCSPERAFLSFMVKYIGSCTGKVNINEALIYDDRDHQEVIFPKPSIIVSREPEPGKIDYREPCSEPVSADADMCTECVVIDGKEEVLRSLGRIVYVNVTLKDICPGKKVALGVILTEVNACGQEEIRGMKTLLIPAHNEEGCRDIDVECIKFAVPEELTGRDWDICKKRRFKVNTIVNYVDTDIICCN